MGEQNYLGAVGLTFLFFLPAIILLFFAWSVWMANKRPSVADWRLAAFKSALIAALPTTALLSVGAARYVITQNRAEGVWLALNWIGALFWLFSAVAAFVGKGSSRILLVCWGIFLFLALYGVDLASIP